MKKKKLKPDQQKFWNRLTGNHNRVVREQIVYMRKNGAITQAEADYLVERSYTVPEAEIWRLIIDHIKVHSMQGFNMNVVIPPRKSTRKRTKNR